MNCMANGGCPFLLNMTHTQTHTHTHTHRIYLLSDNEIELKLSALMNVHHHSIFRWETSKSPVPLVPVKSNMQFSTHWILRHTRARMFTALSPCIRHDSLAHFFESYMGTPLLSLSLFLSLSLPLSLSLS